jgi:hypothetical protein
MEEFNPALRRNHWLRAGLLAAGLGFAVLSGACATTGSTQIDPSRLAGLPPDRLTLVNDQQQALDAAVGQENAAREAKRKAEDRVLQAKADLGVSKAELKKAKVRHEQDQRAFEEINGSESSDLSAMAAARHHAQEAERLVREAQARVDADNARVAYLESLTGLEDGKIHLAQQQVKLDHAELERARLLTLQQTNPAEVHAMKVQPADFDAAVARREADVANANADVARDRADANAKYRMWTARKESAGAERPDDHEFVPPPPRA